MESPMVGLVVLAVAYPVVFLLLIVGLCRAAAASRRVDERAEQDLTKDDARRILEDPVDAEFARLVADTDLEAVVEATRCDCPRCTARRRRVTP